MKLELRLEYVASVKQKVGFCEKNRAVRILLKNCDNDDQKSVSAFGPVIESIVKDVMSPDENMDVRLSQVT